jgi:hypothetical protein
MNGNFAGSQPNASPDRLPYRPAIELFPEKFANLQKTQVGTAPQETTLMYANLLHPRQRPTSATTQYLPFVNSRTAVNARPESPEKIVPTENRATEMTDETATDAQIAADLGRQDIIAALVATTAK